MARALLALTRWAQVQLAPVTPRVGEQVLRALRAQAQALVLAPVELQVLGFAPVLVQLQG